MKKYLHHENHEFDVCVIGGGMSGMCAAIAAARNGAKTAMIHDRPVFGGNASSEIRMWICGAHGDLNKETGLLEEIQLENQYRNPTGIYSIWDSVLYEKIFFQPRLTPFLNCSCTDAEMDGDRIVGVRAWQLTTQTWHMIRAKIFIDCSGDSILAAVTGAEFRSGRESKHEFNEEIQPSVADQKTMGNSLLIQLRRTDEAQAFTPPRWAYKFDSAQDLPHRIRGVHADNFWWLEVGGLQETIRDAESIRDELMKIGYGVWDYIKNKAPERSQADQWALEWMGSLPGKRENRRYTGDHVLTQNDIRDGGDFNDIIAYGGWSMDDHHPAGIYYPGAPTIFHPAPSPYGIPYRTLYSRNISNLLFAGRNISVTHAALSSTRVMGTCSLLGQAAGTAAALCVQLRCDPRGISQSPHLELLQKTLMDDDCWLPGKTRTPSPLTRNSETVGGETVSRLVDGLDRDRENEEHSHSSALGSSVGFTWKVAAEIQGVRLVFDSNLKLQKRMPCSYPHRTSGCEVPKSLIKAYRVESQERNGSWTTVFRETNNYQRLVHLPLHLQTQALRFIPEETWGDPEARLFGFEPLEKFPDKIPQIPEGPAFIEVRSKISEEDLKPAESEVSDEKPKKKRQLTA